jgi:hypothetical protein
MKPLKNITGTKIGNIVNLVIDGNAFQKTFLTQDEANAFYKLMHSARNGDQDALDSLMTELNRRYRTVIKGILEKDDSDNYYLKGIDIKMPELLANTFVDYLENQFPVNALVNFWKLLVSNPDTRVRQDLFKFLQEYNFSITDNGYFIAYKALEVKEQAGLDIASFVSNQYLKIKKWKKNPANYNVLSLTNITEDEVENPEYEYFGDIDDEDDENYGLEDNGEDEYITVEKRTTELKLVDVNAIINIDQSTDELVNLGNLADLFKDIDKLVDNRTVYQSRHSGKDGRKVEQTLGVPVKMNRPDSDTDPKVECSSGLHLGSVKYVENFAHKEDRILLVLVNPAHVVAVPEYDNSKMRVCEYFPYAELERLEGNKFEVVEQAYFEDDYMKYEAADLEKQIEEIQSEIDEVGQVKVLLDYKKILEERLVSIEKVLSE